MAWEAGFAPGARTRVQNLNQPRSNEVDIRPFQDPVSKRYGLAAVCWVLEFVRVSGFRVQPLWSFLKAVGLKEPRIQGVRIGKRYHGR